MPFLLDCSWPCWLLMILPYDSELTFRPPYTTVHFLASVMVFKTPWHLCPYKWLIGISIYSTVPSGFLHSFPSFSKQFKTVLTVMWLWLFDWTWIYLIQGDTSARLPLLRPPFCVYSLSVTPEYTSWDLFTFPRAFLRCGVLSKTCSALRLSWTQRSARVALLEG